MTEELNGDVLSEFSDLPDPRSERNQDHPLISIVMIAICGTICGADNWVEIESYGKAKREWLETMIPLPHGIPSHDTFGRVFRLLDPEAVQSRFLKWVQRVSQLAEGALVAIDGKQMRGSKDIPAGKEAIYMVSAWASHNRMVLGQRRVEEKANEITAIPELLTLLVLKGCIVTIDAIGCQTEIAAQIVDQEADYVLAVKGNQGTLHEDIADLFAGFEEHQFQAVDYDYHKTMNKDHGRIDIRECWVVSRPDYITYLRRHQAWPQLTSLVKIVSERRVSGQSTVKTRYFIASFSSSAQHFLQLCRDHWHIENQLHWVLDVAFGQDHNRVHKDHAPENLAVIHHVALNLLKQEKTARIGVKAKRLKAGWDNAYLLKVMAG